MDSLNSACVRQRRRRRSSVVMVAERGNTGDPFRAKLKGVGAWLVGCLDVMCSRMWDVLFGNLIKIFNWNCGRL